jgi:uncharacterized protein (TIGR03435 family)
MLGHLLIIVGMITAVALPLCSQESNTPKFEVASVKPGDRDSRQVGVHSDNSGRFATTNTTLKILVGYAYGVENNQIANGPAWTDSDVWSIEAKSESRFQVGLDDSKIRLMLQSLLADRFHLSVHRETKEQPVYELVIAKGGPKLKETAPTFAGQNLNGGRGQLMAEGLQMSALAGSLSRQLGRSVIDKTGLAGRYDFKLTYTPEAREGVFGRTAHKTHLLRIQMTCPFLRPFRNSLA